AEQVMVTVVGTGFDVRLAQGGAVVAVRHGVVRVDYNVGPQPQSQLLLPGEWVGVTAKGDVSSGKEPPDQIGVWQTGQLVARDRPMVDVVDELRPYFSGTIVLIGADLSRRRVTGVYDLRDPVEALRALGRAHGSVAVRQVFPWLVVVSER